MTARASNVTRCVEIKLTIPDNEAETAEATLRNLGVALGRLERVDIYRFEIEPGNDDALIAALERIETVYNPNKHALRLRAEARPEEGEAWIHEIAHEGEPPAVAGTVRIAGRILPGVRRIERFTAWRLRDPEGRPAAAAAVTQALETLLCNNAFQRSTTR